MKSDIDIYVIEQVKQKRIESGVSQRMLSEILGRALGFVGQVETPHCPAKYSVHQLHIIAKEFGCSAVEFFPPLDFIISE